MRILNQNMTIRDYCAAYKRGEILINSNYQRSDQVWPEMAKSYLIETIALDYPVPKIFLHQTIDLKSRAPVKHIVDGQQRTRAILDFFDDKHVLAKSLDSVDLAGRRFSELDDQYKQRFLDYGLSIDLFTGASVDEVIEVFRRMNSYTVPLNPEEKRHAQFQGEFKWYVNTLVRRFASTFRDIGAFSNKQLIRMLDAKLITEITHAILYGISTTNAKKLDDLYKEFDREFEAGREIEKLLTDALARAASWQDLLNGPITKPYQLYSLLLAIIHVTHPIPALDPVFASPRLQEVNDQDAVRNLSALGTAIDIESLTTEFAPFIEASTSKTNVKAQREIRFQWFCRALAGQMPT